MRLDRAVARAINEACWRRARLDLRWSIWEDAHRRYSRGDHETPDWYRHFSGVVAAQFLSGLWPPWNGWYKP